ncbi:MAG: hypothetical protein WCL44_01255 [bacterium]
MLRATVPSVFLAASLTLPSAFLMAQQPAQDGQTLTGVFGLPQTAGQQQHLTQQLQYLLPRQQYSRAEELLKAAIERSPDVVDNYYNLACVQARLKRHTTAFASLEKAIEKGFTSGHSLRTDPDLDSLRENPGFDSLLDKAQKKASAGQSHQRNPFAVRPIKAGGVAMVDESNVALDFQSGVFRVMYSLEAATNPLSRIVSGQGKISDMINGWYREGSACGLEGVLYDNHDRGHSPLNLGDYPQLTRLEFAPQLNDAGLGTGLQKTFIFNLPTLGNSSTALTLGPYWRSQSRMAMVAAANINPLYLQYISNQLYFYVEHKDYDPGHNGRNDGYGDTYPANIPYLITSSGSSFTDIPFMQAVVNTLAAFRKDTRQALVLSGTLMPTIQMILRTTATQVKTPRDYLSGKAHPVVFSSSSLDLERMVTLAHDMRADAIPPLAQIRVVSEDEGVPGVDYFDAGRSERLFDTPFAIARVVRSTSYHKRMVVTAENSRDINGRPLKYSWSVLTGDNNGIKITPLNSNGSMVEILIPYHKRRPIEPGSAIETCRVDIGAFVHNGVYYSAPAFLSLYYLDSETRIYTPDNRIASVEYKSPGRGGNYADPMIDLPKDWIDQYHYDKGGRLTGWTRSRGEMKEDFTADGLLVELKDKLGRALEARTVNYVAEQMNPKAQSAPTLIQQPGNEVMSYAYTSDDDRVGRIVSRETDNTGVGSTSVVPSHSKQE